MPYMVVHWTLESANVSPIPPDEFIQACVQRQAEKDGLSLVEPAVMVREEFGRLEKTGRWLFDPATDDTDYLLDEDGERIPEMVWVSCPANRALKVRRSWEARATR